MGRAKNKKTSGTTTRHQFITQTSVGVTSLVALSSCELSDLNIIGKLRGTGSGKPTEKELSAFLQAMQLHENVKKIADRMKKNINNLRPVPPELVKLFSDESVQKLIDDEVVFYTNFYKENYTSNEVRDLTRILNSKLWQKYTNDLQEAGSDSGSPTGERPSKKFTALVNDIMKNSMQEKMKQRNPPKT